MDNSVDSFDPNFCCFCQDALPAGGLLLVAEKTQRIIGKSEFKVCARCGASYTDVRVAQNEETGEIAVFQFEHLDFHRKETQDKIEPLTAYIEDLRCHACDERIERGAPGEVVISAQDFAIKMLRMRPDGATLTATCDSCTEAGECSCCNESESE